MGTSPAVILTSTFSFQTNYEGAIDYIGRKQAQELTGKEGEAAYLLTNDLFVDTKVEDFGNFLNYLSRKTALEKKETLSPHDQLVYAEVTDKITHFKQSSAPSQPPPYSFVKTGLFTADKDDLTLAEKKELQLFFRTGERNGAVLFQDVVSFDTAFLIQEKLYNPLNKVLDEKRLKQAARVMMKKYFELEHLELTGRWVGDIHYNTDHFHIHFATTEQFNTRRMKKINHKGKDVTVPHATKKLSTIKAMKSTFANSLIDRQAQLEQLSQLRNTLVKHIRERPTSDKTNQLLSDLRRALPEKQTKWQVASLSPLATEKLNLAVKECLRDSNVYAQLKEALLDESQFRQNLYTTSDRQTYYQNKLGDMDKRLGNALLKRLKQVETESHSVPLEKNPDPQEKTNLDQFSKHNQKLIKEQFPNAQLIRGENAWTHHGRILKKEAVPITITYPVMDKKTEKLIGFENGEVYDVSQTVARARHDEQLAEFMQQPRPFEKLAEEKIKNNPMSSGLENSTQPVFTREKTDLTVSNLQHFSVNNQKLITDQYPDAHLIQGETAWRFDGRGIKKEAKPILITFPVFDEKTEKLKGFEMGEVFDIGQTEVLAPQHRRSSFETAASHQLDAQADALNRIRENNTKSLAEEKNKNARFSSYNQRRIQERMPGATDIRTEQEWLKNGRRVDYKQAPVFLKMARFLPDGKREWMEVPFYDVSQTHRLSEREQRAYRQEYHRLNSTTQSNAPRFFYSKDLSLKLSDLLKKDVNKEQALYEHDQMTRTIAYLQQQPDHGLR